MNIDTRQLDVQCQLKKEIHGITDCKGDMIHMPSSPEAITNGYCKRGGTMISIKRKLAGECVGKEEDPYGRWCQIIIDGQNDQKLSIFLIYRECNQHHHCRSEIYSTFMTLPFLYGFTLDRWKQSLHVMPQKMKSSFHHKQSIVQLFEADFNAALKIL